MAHRRVWNSILRKNKRKQDISRPKSDSQELERIPSKLDSCFKSVSCIN